MALSINMYQVMVEIDTLGLKDVCRTLACCKEIPEAFAHPPGLLQCTITDFEKYEIGSISFKTQDNTSILLFKDKMKLSGSVKNEYAILMSDSPDDEMNTFIETKIKEINDIICFTYKSYYISLINGRFKGNKIQNYMKFAEDYMHKYKKKYDRMIAPFVNKRGRIAALKLYPEKKIKKSIHFDHSGSVQFFAFKKVTDLILTYMDFKETL